MLLSALDGEDARAPRAVAALLLSLLCAGSSVRAMAQGECPPGPTPGPLEVTPAAGAGGVTRDARIVVRYTPGYFDGFVGDPSSLLSLWDDDTLEPVPGVTQVVGDDLFFLPDGLLAPGATYVGRATGGIADFEFDFRTGSTLDTLPPTLGSLRSVSTQGVEPGCGLPDGGYRVDVTMDRAVEDGPDGSLEYLLYQTRGVGLSAPVLRARRRGVTTSDLFTMAFVLPRDEAVEPICVVVQVVDGVGKRDDSMQPRCFDPVEGTFFEPACAVGRGRGGGPFGPSILVLVALWLRRRRR